MNSTPYIAQFSEYDLSSQAHPTKKADRREDSHNRIASAAKTVPLFFSPPTIISIVEITMYNKTAGISMGILAFLWHNPPGDGQGKTL